MKKKVIFFLSPEVTGAERVSVTLAKKLDIEEYDVAFAILGNTFGDIISFIPNRYQYHLVPLLHLEDYLQRERPHEVFCSLINLNGEVLKAARKVGGIRVVLRNNYLLKDVSDDLRLRAKDYYPKADMIIAQTEQMKKELIEDCGVSENRIKVVDNPIDTEYIDEHVNSFSSPYPADGKVHFCWIGRFEWIKGVDVMIEAFYKAYQENENISLFLIGKEAPESTYFQNLKKYVDQNKMQKVIHFVGFKRNPYNWMAHADGIIIPSRSEANSNVAKEANYLGIPIISTIVFPLIFRKATIVMSEDYNQMATAILKQVMK